MRVRLVVVLAAAGGVMSMSTVDAVAAASCPKGRLCTTVTVPLDRTGAVPGAVRLHVQRAPARRSLQPPLFVLTGDGASTTRQFDDGSPEDGFEERWPDRRGRNRLGTVKRERVRDVVIVDQRGAGRSGALDCPALQRQWYEGSASAAAACAASLGPRRAFYTTQDSIEDLEAVRAALGAPRIALYGGYGGARVVLGYARRHPDRVERMLLDSPTDAGEIDPLRRSAFEAAPRILGRICGGRRCRGITNDLTGDVKRLAARLERGPVRGRLPDGRGRRRPVRVSGFDLLALAGSTSNPFGPTELPGVTRNALRGDFAPLLRAAGREPLTALGPWSPRRFSWATYAATRCEAPGFPWPSATPTRDRMSRGLAFARGLPTRTFGLFGPRAAVASDVIELCRQWPAAGRAAAVLAPLPPVPTLIVTGDELVAPLEDARAIAAQVPGARVVVARVQHFSAFDDPPSSCRGLVVSSFLAGDESWRTRHWCPGARPRIEPLDPPPPSLGELAPAGGEGAAGRTLAAVQRTVADGFASLLIDRAAAVLDRTPPVIEIGALRAGSYRFAHGRLMLRGASLVPGVRVTGWIERYFDAKRGRGRLQVRGPAASKGALTLSRGALSGHLGGRTVRARLADANLDRLFD